VQRAQDVSIEFSLICNSDNTIFIVTSLTKFKVLLTELFCETRD